MSKQADPGDFGKFVPGFDFLQKLAQGGAASMASWVAPTMDAKALDKRIDELRAVQFWLDQNAAALKATIQALEVQKMTLATLRSMNVPMPAATPEPPPAAKPDPAPPGGASAGNAMPDPLQFWSALTTQFQQIAAGALKDTAARAGSTAAPASKTATRKSETPARKAPAKRRPKA